MTSNDEHHQQQASALLSELCSLVFSILRSPHAAIPFSDPLPPSPSRPRAAARRSQVSPGGFASLLLGASLALMLCGSVTFVIGFILMPWVLGLVVVFYFVGILLNLSGIWRAVLCPSPPASVVVRTTSQKEIAGQLFSKLPLI